MGMESNMKVSSNAESNYASENVIRSLTTIKFSSMMMMIKRIVVVVVSEKEWMLFFSSFSFGS